MYDGEGQSLSSSVDTAPLPELLRVFSKATTGSSELYKSVTHIIITNLS